MAKTAPSTIVKAFNKRKPGSLHKALGVEQGKRIPIEKLVWAVKNCPKPLADRAKMVLQLKYGRSV